MASFCSFCRSPLDLFTARRRYCCSSCRQAAYRLRLRRFRRRKAALRSQLLLSDSVPTETI